MTALKRGCNSRRALLLRFRTGFGRVFGPPVM
jgi:hypothetical protein